MRNVAVRFVSSVDCQRSTLMRVTGTSSGSHVPALAPRTGVESAERLDGVRDQRVGGRLVAQVGLQRDAADRAGQRRWRGSWW